MSLVGTLGRMAVGIAVAKGVGSLMNKGGGSGGLGGLGGLLGSVLGGGQQQQQAPGSNLGNSTGGTAPAGGGLGGLSSLSVSLTATPATLADGGINFAAAI